MKNPAEAGFQARPEGAPQVMGRSGLVACRERPSGLRAQGGLGCRGRLGGGRLLRSSLLGGCSLLRGSGLLGCCGLLHGSFFGRSGSLLGRSSLLGGCGGLLGGSSLLRWSSSLLHGGLLGGCSGLLGCSSLLGRSGSLLGGSSLLRRSGGLLHSGLFSRGSLLGCHFLRSCHTYLLDQVAKSTAPPTGDTGSTTQHPLGSECGVVNGVGRGLMFWWPVLFAALGQSQDRAPPDWYSMTRVSKKLRSFFRSIISLIQGKGFSSLGKSSSSPIWVARRLAM